MAQEIASSAILEGIKLKRSVYACAANSCHTGLQKHQYYIEDILIRPICFKLWNSTMHRQCRCKPDWRRLTTTSAFRRSFPFLDEALKRHRHTRTRTTRVRPSLAHLAHTSFSPVSRCCWLVTDRMCIDNTWTGDRVPQ